MYQNKEHKLQTEQNAVEKPRGFNSAPDYLKGSMVEEYKKRPAKSGGNQPKKRRKRANANRD